MYSRLKFWEGHPAQQILQNRQLKIILIIIIFTVPLKCKKQSMAE